MSSYENGTKLWSWEADQLARQSCKRYPEYKASQQGPRALVSRPRSLSLEFQPVIDYIIMALVPLNPQNMGGKEKNNITLKTTKQKGSILLINLDFALREVSNHLSKGLVSKIKKVLVFEAGV